MKKGAYGCRVVETLCLVSRLEGCCRARGDKNDDKRHKRISTTTQLRHVSRDGERSDAEVRSVRGRLPTGLGSYALWYRTIFFNSHTCGHRQLRARPFLRLSSGRSALLPYPHGL